VLDATATLPPVTFTEAEAVALATMLAAEAEAPFQADGRRALTKVRAAMTAVGRDRVDALAARVWVRSSSDHQRPPQLRVVEEALRAGRVAVIDYVDRDGQSSTRRPVEPVAFARDRGRWYLLAWCRRARAARWFRLDRIAAADLTTEPAPERDVRTIFGQPPDDATPVEV
jgi:predicted DNA-binding transcriptional regulator YafY